MIRHLATAPGSYSLLQVKQQGRVSFGDLQDVNVVESSGTKLAGYFPDASTVTLGQWQSFVAGYTISHPTPEEAASTGYANRDDLLAKAQTALTSNATFLAIASPTNAQTLTQVQRLTRQMDAVIKLQLQDFTDTTGT